MIVIIRVLVFTVLAVSCVDQTQLERYGDQTKSRTYQLDIPGKDPITIIETDPVQRANDKETKWIDITVTKDMAKDEVTARNLMTDIIYDHKSDKPRCFGPSCQDGFMDADLPNEQLEEYLSQYSEKNKDYHDYNSEKYQAISELVNKLKKEKYKNGNYYFGRPEIEEDNSESVYSAWNKMKVKKHKHPFDDKDGWVALEPVPWSTSKISKWKPNVKKQRPSHWNDDSDRYSSNPGYFQNNDQMPSYSQNKPTVIRPAFINNRLHVTSSGYSHWNSKPNKSSWNRPQSYNYPGSWDSDDNRRPSKPHCESEDSESNEENYYGLSDSVVLDNQPSHFPFEYEALKRPIKRPTPVIYTSSDRDRDSERISIPSLGNGQWVLLSTTKGYRNKKRQRSLFDDSDSKEKSDDPPTITSHQSVALTVLPAESRKNMTTSHGGMLEVERSFKTVEESKSDMDRMSDNEDHGTTDLAQRPVRNKIIRKQITLQNSAPDATSVLAAVGAGMVPATMAMVMPMVVGRRRRRRRDLYSLLSDIHDTYVH